MTLASLRTLQVLPGFTAGPVFVLGCPAARLHPQRVHHRVGHGQVVTGAVHADVVTRRAVSGQIAKNRQVLYRCGRLGLDLDPGEPGMTVAEWLEGWLEGKQRTRRASTVRSYESYIRVHISRVIGELPLERVNPGHVEAVLATVGGSAGTRHRVLATMRAALNAAVKQRLTTWNPSGQMSGKSLWRVCGVRSLRCRE